MEKSKKRKKEELNDDILRYVRDHRSEICPPREDDEETTRFQSNSPTSYSTNKMLLQRSLHKSRVSELSQAGNLNAYRAYTSAMYGTADDKPSSTGTADEFTTVRHAEEYKMECKISYKSSNYKYSQNDYSEKRQPSLRLETDISIADIDKSFSGLKGTLTAPNDTDYMAIDPLGSIASGFSEANASRQVKTIPRSQSVKQSMPSTEKSILTSSDENILKDGNDNSCQMDGLNVTGDDTNNVPVKAIESGQALSADYFGDLLSRIKNSDVTHLRSTFPCSREVEKEIHVRTNTDDPTERHALLKSLKIDYWSKITTGVELLRQRIAEYAVITETCDKWLNALEIQKQIEEKQQEIDRLKAHQKNLAYPANLDVIPVYRSSVSSTTEIIPYVPETKAASNTDLTNDDEASQRAKNASVKPVAIRKSTQLSNGDDLTSDIVLYHKKTDDDKKYGFDDCLHKCIEIVRKRTPLSIVISSAENKTIISQFLSEVRHKYIKRYLKKFPASAANVLLVLEFMIHDIGQVKSLLEPMIKGDLGALAQKIYTIMTTLAVQVYSSTRTTEYSQRKKDWQRFLQGALLKSKETNVENENASDKGTRKPEISIVSFPIEKNSFQDALNTEPLLMGPGIYDRRKRHDPSNKSAIPSWSVPSSRV